jgi:hypothetical protein
VGEGQRVGGSTFFSERVEGDPIFREDYVFNGQNGTFVTVRLVFCLRREKNPSQKTFQTFLVSFTSFLSILQMLSEKAKNVIFSRRDWMYFKVSRDQTLTRAICKEALPSTNKKI